MGNPLQIIINGLTYEGNLSHSVINYSLILFMTAPYLKARKRPHWIVCFLIALAAQVILWFIADAVGVSVIWCALAGYSLIEVKYLHMTREPFPDNLFISAFFSALVGILYYALTLPFITTLAHGIAVLMGCGIWYLLRIFKYSNNENK